MSDDALVAELARLIAAEPTSRRAPGPVSESAIRAWCEAMDDTNPIHRDPAAAQAAGFPGVVAPPAMLFSWAMPGIAQAYGRDTRLGGDVRRLFVAHGYDAVVATRFDQRTERYLVLGDHITEQASVASVSARKDTALGTGYFVNIVYAYTDADDRPVGSAEMAAFYFRRAPAPTVQPRPRPVIGHDNRFWWDGIAAGQLLIQQCEACGALRHPPGPMCPECLSTQWTTLPASGAGTLYSFTIHHHPPLPGFTNPYAVGLVALAEGVRIVAPLASHDASQLRIGAPVRLTFRRDPNGIDYPCFELADAPPPASAPRSAAPPVAAAGEPAVGTPLPAIEIPLSTTQIIAAAIASNDFQPVHHDSELARRQGLKDIIMNIMTVGGLISRYATATSAPGTFVRSLSLKLGVPSYPGDTLALAGTAEPVDGGDTRLHITGTNSLGVAVRADVELLAAPPAGAA